MEIYIVIHIIAGILVYGLNYASYVRTHPTIAKRMRSQNIIHAIIQATAGPLGFFVFLAGPWKYKGFQWRE